MVGSSPMAVYFWHLNHLPRIFPPSVPSQVNHARFSPI
uniref:Uncharacterized protein n=1 Tax=Arundo donax TaxID=35708 RepID=A0A0A9C7S1_ARUDO